MPTRRSKPTSADAPASKRPKTEHATINVDGSDFVQYFTPGLFDESNVARLSASYCESRPFLHVVIDKLFQDDLLTKVKDECIDELSFTEKETDIYKVNQTGDLASLSYLAGAQIALLPSLLKLRDALYSPAFRSFLRKVTGCGPLSGIKQDMSVNSYKKGCHLLNHDDVIGTRRVSYILYMPLPKSEEWRAEWGGALELYPVRLNADGISEPEATPSKTLPPSWNQFVFFEVQPGHSFHSVQEVTVEEDDHQRQRLSISGWFHKAQEGEEGYEIELSEKKKSSLEQLISTETDFKIYPFLEDAPMESPFLPLTDEEIAFLSHFLDPVYLSPKVLSALAERFVEESSLELHKFLREPLAQKLEMSLCELDKKDGLDWVSRQGRVPSHSAGVAGAWGLRGPPHKRRYCVLAPSASSNNEEAISIISSPDCTAEQILFVLESTLFPSSAFRAWLTTTAKLIPMGYSVEARRFRPGLDYTLAMANKEQSVLDVTLGLTPEIDRSLRHFVGDDNSKGKAKVQSPNENEEEEKPGGWEMGEWGGWECYLAPQDKNEDPAVYVSTLNRKGSTLEHAPDGAHEQNATSYTEVDIAKESSVQDEGDENEDDGGEGDDADDNTLLTTLPGFNRLTLVLRDEGVLHCVKYLSADAPGSRWDVCGEYNVFMIAEEDDNDEE